MRRYLFLSLLALSAASLLTGCNIVRGVGQDMAAVGRTLAKTADRSGSNNHDDSSSNLPPAPNTTADPAADYDYGWEN